MVKKTFTKEDIYNFQECIFYQVSEVIKLRLPDESLKITVPNIEIEKDLSALRCSGLFKWDPTTKFRMFCDIGVNHPIKLVVYYRKLPIGYAYGCYNERTMATEISLIEKRSDSHQDLYKLFLPIVIEALTAYSISLCTMDIWPKRLALTNPLESKIIYYQNSGLRYDEDYDKGMPAMILDLQP